MDWLTFISETLKTLIWPLTLVTFFIKFQVPISRLIDTIKKGHVGSFFHFERDLEKATKKAQMVLPLGETDESVDTFLLKARKNPKALLLDSSKRLNKVAFAAVGGKPSMTDARIALKGLVLDDDQHELLVDLEEIANRAKFLPEYEFSPEMAAQYADTASKLENYISTKTTTPKN